MARLLQLLLLIVLAFIAWRLLRQWVAGLMKPEDPPDGANDARFEPTARCEQCGTHVPSSELNEARICPRCRQPAP